MAEMKMEVLGLEAFLEDAEAVLSSVQNTRQGVLVATQEGAYIAAVVPVNVMETPSQSRRSETVMTTEELMQIVAQTSQLSPMWSNAQALI